VRGRKAPQACTLRLADSICGGVEGHATRFQTCDNPSGAGILGLDAKPQPSRGGQRKRQEAGVESGPQISNPSSLIAVAGFSLAGASDQLVPETADSIGRRAGHAIAPQFANSP